MAAHPYWCMPGACNAVGMTGVHRSMPTTIEGYAANLYASDFVYCVSRDFVKACTTPFLILPGNDRAHPLEVAEEINRLAPNAEYIADWKEGDKRDAAFKRAREFLLEHTPAASQAAAVRGG